jgi:hypothetical protein
MVTEKCCEDREDRSGRSTRTEKCILGITQDSYSAITLNTSVKMFIGLAKNKSFVILQSTLAAISSKIVG